MKKDTGLLIIAGIGIVFLGKGLVSYIGELSPAQIATFAGNAGFTGNNLITAVSIALAESGGDPNALGDLTLGFSYGLWQINAKAHPEFGPDFTTLYDPQTNANAAYSVYAGAGYSFTPWSTYNGGQYSSFVSEVQTALQG